MRSLERTSAEDFSILDDQERGHDSETNSGIGTAAAALRGFNAARAQESPRAVVSVR
jgi:hypothetical protein